MDSQNIKELLDKILERSKKYGFEDAEAKFSSGISMEISVLQGEIQCYDKSALQDVAFKGKKNGQTVYSESNDFSDEAIDFMLSNASDNCDILDDEDESFIYCDPEHSELVFSQITDAFDKNTYDRFSELGLKLEKDIFALDPSIRSVDYLTISCDRSFSYRKNTKGLYMYTDNDGVTVLASALAEKDGQVKTGGHLWYGTDIDDFDESEFLGKVSENLLEKFGGSSVPSGKYDIILKNSAVISFFASFIGVFNAYTMQKGLSLLKGREGENIASSCLTLREEPMYEKAFIKKPFDGEGVLTTKKDIISNGVFKTAFYSLKSANKAGVKSTGNAGGPTTMLIDPGQKTFDELCETVGNGLIITELSGLHAGLNAISGDFSLLCEGFLIENGKKSRAVEQITVSGNFYQVLQNITEIGNDVISEYGGSEYFCPSMIVKDIAVAGEE